MMTNMFDKSYFASVVTEAFATCFLFADDSQLRPTTHAGNHSNVHNNENVAYMQ